MSICQEVNTLRPRQNGHHFADDIFECIFMNENVWLSLRISLKFVRKVRINNTVVLVQIMAWRRPGDKPLSEPMMISFMAHICVTGPQWVDQGWPSFRTYLRNIEGNDFTLLYKFSAFVCFHYIDVIMTTMASQITILTVVYSTVYSDADQRKHQSSASPAFVRGIRRDRWIPRTKGQLRGKCFHLMTSSCDFTLQ